MFNRQPGAHPGGAFGKKSFQNNQPFHQKPVNNAGGGGGNRNFGTAQNAGGSGGFRNFGTAQNASGGGGNGGGGYRNGGTAQSRPAIPPANRSGWSCMHCSGTSFHSLDTCNYFLQANVQRRYDMMRRGGHCYKCFAQKHKAQDCQLDVVRCDKCKTNNHHTLLHPDRSTQ